MWSRLPLDSPLPCSLDRAPLRRSLLAGVGGGMGGVGGGSSPWLFCSLRFFCFPYLLPWGRGGGGRDLFRSCPLAFTPLWSPTSRGQVHTAGSPGRQAHGSSEGVCLPPSVICHRERRTGEHSSGSKQPRPICTQWLGCNLFITLCILATKVSTALVQIRLQSACQKRLLRAFLFGKKCHLWTLNVL